MIRDFLHIIPTRALERVNPNWLHPVQAEQVSTFKERRERRKVFAEVQR